MTSDTKITVHQLYATYAKRFADKHSVSTKSVIEGLIDDHLVDAMIGLEPSSIKWTDFQMAANSLLPPDWSIRLINKPTPTSISPQVLHALKIGNIARIYVTSSALKRFGLGIKEVSRIGYSVCLNSELKAECAGVQVKRRGNGLLFIPYGESFHPKTIEQTTFPTRHVDKICRAFDLSIKAKELKTGLKS